MTTLFTAADLSGWLHEPVSDVDAAAVETVVWGWLAPVLNLTDRPDPVPANLFSSAVELGGIAYSNPQGLTRNDLGDLKQYFSLERREQILEEVYRGGIPDSIPMKPRGNFPPAQCYPDPVIDYLRRAQQS